MPTINKWDYRFLELAKLVSTWSKDPRKSVGAVVVINRRILGTGYNGFPTGLSDSLELYNDREYKNKHIVHAEANAIYNCPVKPIGATIYCTYAPCLACSLVIIQSGISKVVCPELDSSTNWYSNQLEAKQYMTESGIEVVEVKRLEYQI